MQVYIPQISIVLTVYLSYPSCGVMATASLKSINCSTCVNKQEALLSEIRSEIYVWTLWTQEQLFQICGGCKGHKSYKLFAELLLQYSKKFAVIMEPTILPISFSCSCMHLSSTIIVFGILAYINIGTLDNKRMEEHVKLKDTLTGENVGGYDRVRALLGR